VRGVDVLEQRRQHLAQPLPEPVEPGTPPDLPVLLFVAVADMDIPPVDAGVVALAVGLELVVPPPLVVVAEGLALVGAAVGLLLAVLPPVTVIVAFMFGWSAQ